jgi:hypothetical protein
VPPGVARAGDWSNGTWTLYHAIQTPSGSNIEVGSTECDPADVTIVEIGGVAQIEEPVDCSGTLENPGDPGTSTINAWDGTNFKCSGHFPVTVKPDGGSRD